MIKSGLHGSLQWPKSGRPDSGPTGLGQPGSARVGDPMAGPTKGPKLAHNQADNQSDEGLMAAVCRADTAAYQRLVHRHALRYRALAYRFLGDRDAAEDCVQDAFTALWQKPDRFNPHKARFTTWFHRVVINRALDMKRRKPHQGLPAGFDVADNRPTAADQLMEQQKWQGIHQAINALPDRQALAVRLVYFDGLSNQSAAAVLKLHIKAFESLLGRARAALRKAIAVTEYHEDKKIRGVSGHAGGKAGTKEDQAQGPSQTQKVQ